MPPGRVWAELRIWGGATMRLERMSTEHHRNLIER